ncbi:putative defense protein [Mya arenaria]|uniref:putative defense protein n=1 Tax=Mya arenaria TaxID=6604 RepID=UPI0022E639CA|nr:putative defense protein [Mya arenaria]
MKFSTFIGVLLGVSCCHGYSLGPPLNACGAMFPWGHGVQARNDSPPFSFRLNSTSYSPGDVIEVFLNTSQEMFGDYFLEGALIQMRPVTCKVNSIGTFSVQQQEDFLEPFGCFERDGSALRHYAHIHIYNRTFYWTAPSKPSGHLFIRATIARNQKNFWTNVYSDYILDKSGGTPANLNHCTTGGAVKLAVSSILAGFTIVLTLILL